MHFRFEGRRSRSICGAKLPPGERPKMISREADVWSLPAAVPGLCAECLKRAWVMLRAVRRRFRNPIGEF